ncbi:MAG: hypothetical protein J6V54_03605 [Bacteroidales bacterium]|nr:hypothetical protein [Bacteroidales bacterium]
MELQFQSLKLQFQTLKQLFQTLKRVYKTSKTSFRHVPMQFVERSTAVFETPMPDKGAAA